MEDYIIYNDDVDIMMEMVEAYQNEEMYLEGKLLDEATAKGKKEHILIKIIKFIPRLIRAIVTQIRKVVQNKILDMKIKKLRKWSQEEEHVQEAFAKKEKVNISFTLHRLNKFVDQFAGYVKEACKNADEMLSLLTDFSKETSDKPRDYESYLKSNVFSIHTKISKHVVEVQKWVDELSKDVDKSADIDNYYQMQPGKDRDLLDEGIVYKRVEVHKGLDYVDRMRKTLVICCKYMETTVKLFDDFDYTPFAKNDFQQTYHGTQAIGKNGYYSRKTIVEDFTPMLKCVDDIRNDFKVLANASQQIINYLVDWVNKLYKYTSLGDAARAKNDKIQSELKKRQDELDAEERVDNDFSSRDALLDKKNDYWNKRFEHEEKNRRDKNKTFDAWVNSPLYSQDAHDLFLKDDKMYNRNKRRRERYDKIKDKYKELLDRDAAEREQRILNRTNERRQIYDKFEQLREDPYNTERLKHEVEYMTFDDVMK